jgi:hypothetical protein
VWILFSDENPCGAAIFFITGVISRFASSSGRNGCEESSLT